MITADFLHFTFTSDDSTNFWGYKVTIEAEVVVEESNWLQNLRDTCNYLIVLLNKSLISSNFTMPECDTTCEALNSILVKFGISD